MFHPSLYDRTIPIESWWRSSVPAAPFYPALASDETAEVAVIGGGYAGLSTAYHLAKDHGVDVRLLEAGPIAWGASGRNGGFCCMGASFLSLEQMVEKYGRDEAKAFVQAELKAIALVGVLAHQEGIEIDRQGQGIVTIAHKKERVAELARDAAALRDLAQVPVRLYSAEAFGREGFWSPEQHGAMHVGAGFGLNPLKYAQGLAAAAARRGAKLHANSEALAWKRDGDLHELVTQGGVVRAKRVVVACNGWLPEHLHPAFRGRVMPVMSNIIVTRPLTEDEFWAHNYRIADPVTNTRELLYYFRLLPDWRILFGGRGDTTGTPLAARRMRRSLERSFATVFPGWAHVEKTHFWRGFIAATLRLTPSVGYVPEDPTVSFAYGCHGNGVAFMTWAGRELARMIAKKAKPLPAPIAGMSRPFPAPAWRQWQLRMALARSALRDRWS